jgi:hypothetical protein
MPWRGHALIDRLGEKRAALGVEHVVLEEVVRQEVVENQFGALFQWERKHRSLRDRLHRPSVLLADSTR